MTNVDFSPVKSLNKPLILHVAWLGFNLTSTIIAGENDGKTLQHDFTVLDLNEFPKTNNSVRYHWQFKTPQIYARGESKSRGVAMWVTELEDPSPIQIVGGWID